MEKLVLKNKLLNQCIAAQTKTVNNIREAMDEVQKSADDHTQIIDHYDSYRTQLFRKHEMFVGQLQKAIDQLEILNKIDPNKIKERVEFGAVVITNFQKLFVATSVGKVSVDNNTYFTISPMVPFFHAMRNKKKDEEFDFRGQKFRIEELF